MCSSDLYDIPEVGRSSKGKAIANLVQMAEGEKMAAMIRVQQFPEVENQRFIVMCTSNGTIKNDFAKRGIVEQRQTRTGPWGWKGIALTLERQELLREAKYGNSSSWHGRD